jgi:hypothetical protein
LLVLYRKCPNVATPFGFAEPFNCADVLVMPVAGAVDTFGVFDGVAVEVLVGVTVCVDVGVLVAVLEGVAVGVIVGVAVGIPVGVNVGVKVAVGVMVAVEVGVLVAVFVGPAATIVIKPSRGGLVVGCPLNVKRKFPEFGLVFQCNCDVLPIAPTALNLNLNKVPAPSSGAVPKQEAFSNPGVLGLRKKAQPSLRVPLPTAAGLSGVMTAGS